MGKRSHGEPVRKNAQTNRPKGIPENKPTIMGGGRKWPKGPISRTQARFSTGGEEEPRQGGAHQSGTEDPRLEGVKDAWTIGISRRKSEETDMQKIRAGQPDERDTTGRL